MSFAILELSAMEKQVTTVKQENEGIETMLRRWWRVELH